MARALYDMIIGYETSDQLTNYCDKRNNYFIQSLLTVVL